MTQPLGNSKINTHPCTPEDANANWSVQNTINNNVTNLLQGGAGGDTYKVASNATDAGNATADYLNAKVDQASIPSDTHIIPVRSETIGNITELFGWSVAEVSGWTDEGSYAFVITDGVPSFMGIGTAIDDRRVFVSSTDAAAKFLHEAMYNPNAYVAGADIVVGAATVGGASTNQKEQYFVDVNLIDGWDASAFRLLGIASNISHYYTITQVGAYLYADSSFVAGIFAALPDKHRLVRGTASASAASSSTVSLTSLVVLANGTTAPGSPLSVTKLSKENIPAGAYVTAIYNLSQTRWEVVAVERFRAIRGAWYSGTSTLTINNIVALDSGLDPRTDTTSTTETVTVTNVPGDTYSSGDKVYADYNAKDGIWEARPVGGGSSEVLRTARVYTQIEPATSSRPEDWGVGMVKLVDQATGLVTGDAFEVSNEWDITYLVDAKVKLRGLAVEYGGCYEFPWYEGG